MPDRYADAALPLDVTLVCFLPVYLRQHVFGIQTRYAVFGGFNAKQIVATKT